MRAQTRQHVSKGAKYSSKGGNTSPCPLKETVAEVEYEEEMEDVHVRVFITRVSLVDNKRTTCTCTHTQKVATTS